MALIILKIIGFVYYTVVTTSLTIFINFALRLRRKPNPLFYMKLRTFSKGLTILYSIFNIFIFFFFFSNKINAFVLYLLNEVITIFFSYFILAGFHVYGITGQICSGKTSACDYLKRHYKASIISLDEINKDILREHSTIQAIKKEFGDEVITREYGRETINDEIF